MRAGLKNVATRMKSQNNMKQVVMAMLDYQEANGHLPPAATRDPKGRLLLSWRVLILPYLEERPLYGEFHLDEPWDSPHNLRLLPGMPKIYASLSKNDSPKSFTTHFQVFTGKGTAFEGPAGLHLPDDFPDGTANTFLIVEAAQAVPWTKPQDLPYDPSEPLPALGNFSPEFFFAAVADASVDWLGRGIAEQRIRARITRNGGETLDPD